LHSADKSRIAASWALDGVGDGDEEKSSRMDAEFADDELDRLEVDPKFKAGYCAEIVRAFRKVMGVIRAAADERDFYALKSLRFEKLKPPREHQRSMRLNDQWRLIVELHGDHPAKKVRVIGIEDYH
jgi:proteic killer suppression protein